MGYYSSPSGVRCFEPDNTEDTLYVASTDMSISDLVEKARKHFGQDTALEDLIIHTEYIHTDCIGYDLYDSSDYTIYYVIQKI